MHSSPKYMVSMESMCRCSPIEMEEAVSDPFLTLLIGKQRSKKLFFSIAEVMNISHVY